MKVPIHCRIKDASELFLDNDLSGCFYPSPQFIATSYYDEKRKKDRKLVQYMTYLAQ